MYKFVMCWYIVLVYRFIFSSIVSGLWLASLELVALCIYLSIHLSIYLSLSLYIYMYMYNNTYIYICIAIHVSMYLCVYVPMYLSTCLSIYLSICLSVYLSICLSLSLSIYLSIYLSLSIYIHICIICINTYIYIYMGRLAGAPRAPPSGRASWLPPGGRDASVVCWNKYLSVFIVYMLCLVHFLSFLCLCACLLLRVRRERARGERRARQSDYTILWICISKLKSWCSSWYHWLSIYSLISYSSSLSI